MTADIELLPLPTSWDCWIAIKMEEYALANMEPLLAEIEALRAEVAKQSAYAKRTHDWNTELLANNERLAEALRLIATPQRSDGTWNRDREACQQIAEDALRDHDQEGKDG